MVDGGADRIVIELAGEPRGKGRPQFVRATGHAFTPQRTRTYESALRFAAQEAMGSRRPLDMPLRVSVLAVFPVPPSWSKGARAAALAGTLQPAKAPDADNLLKVLDSLNQVVWCDDRQIVEAHILKAYGVRPCFRVEIEPLGTPAIKAPAIGTARTLFEAVAP